jgi:hypothetical protein
MFDRKAAEYSNDSNGRLCRYVRLSREGGEGRRVIFLEIATTVRAAWNNGAGFCKRSQFRSRLESLGHGQSRPIKANHGGTRLYKAENFPASPQSGYSISNAYKQREMFHTIAP